MIVLSGIYSEGKALAGVLAGSGLVAAALKNPPKKKTKAAIPTTSARAPINASNRITVLRCDLDNPD